MSQQKPKKTFLKKGTRQFLSNATVRSLSQKPKIVQFQDDDDNQNFNSPFINPSSTKNDRKQDIVINVKSKTFSKQKNTQNTSNSKPVPKKTNNLVQKSKNNSNQLINFKQQSIPVNTKNTNIHSNNTNSSAAKNIPKKPTLLTDYLNTDSKTNSKKLVTQNNNVGNNTKFNSNTVVQSQVQHLKMQDLQDDSDQDSYSKKFYKHQEQEDHQNEFLQKHNKKQTKIPVKNTPLSNNRQSQNNSDNQIVINTNPQQTFGKKKPNLLQQAYRTGKQKPIKDRQPVNLKQKQNINSYNKQPLQNQDDEKQQIQQIKFDSDSDDDNKHKKNQFKSKKTKTTYHNNRFQQDIDQEENRQNEQDEYNNNEIQRKATVKFGSKPQSKVTQMFNKNSDKKGNTQNVEQTSTKLITGPKKLTLNDIPEQLIQELVNKYFIQKKQKYDKKHKNLIDQVMIVQKKKQSLIQQQKTLQKRIKQFQKQMQERNKQFQNKIKSQQNKISRQKMYLKDHQTTNKVDWKTKNEVQQLRQQLQEQRNDKKRVEVKLKGQLDRLKVRYNQQMQAKKILENRIKDYELKQIKQKEIKYKEDKQHKIQTIQKKKTFWDDAPKKSPLLQRLYQKEFSLCQFDLESYFYQNNQFYQYYKSKGSSDILQAQQVQGNKIKRTYQNGKIQIQSIQKFVKQVFPWGYTIVWHLNGDIKQVIQIPNNTDPKNPFKLEIYYAKNNNIIQYSISEGRQLHYFLSKDQIQLKDELYELTEVYNGNQLQRLFNGVTTILEKNSRGKFVQTY